ncbi:MAG TPA: heparan-alpha-glucosaminide N-acetyltransferase domain-containing protein, partial [Paludibacteraceae bacterium]|nr:heparan-alpha-glucosaminide N-acetyltransferase domain-containing protein [Paludibacteraceae bacterium]
MATATGKQGRLHSLDVLRGITIAGMILVNNPGNWGNVYAPLRHAEWNGLTPTDLVFPFFMFIMGVSMYLSYKKFDFKFSNRTFLKLFRRSLLLFLIGVAIGWLGLFCGGLREFQGTDVSLGERIWQAATNFENVRILGVLQRLALVSF